MYIPNLLECGNGDYAIETGTIPLNDLYEYNNVSGFGLNFRSAYYARVGNITNIQIDSVSTNDGSYSSVNTVAVSIIIKDTSSLYQNGVLYPMTVINGYEEAGQDGIVFQQHSKVCNETAGNRFWHVFQISCGYTQYTPKGIMISAAPIDNPTGDSVVVPAGSQFVFWFSILNRTNM